MQNLNKPNVIGTVYGYFSRQFFKNKLRGTDTLYQEKLFGEKTCGQKFRQTVPLNKLTMARRGPSPVGWCWAVSVSSALVHLWFTRDSHF